MLFLQASILQAYDQLLSAVGSASSIAFRSSQVQFVARLIFHYMSATDELHQDNMSVCFIPPYTPPLYSKTGVYKGIHNFLIFAPEHRLWVLVRTASLRRF